MSPRDERSAVLQEARRLAPDGLVVAAWPLLKLGATVADVVLWRHRRAAYAASALRWRAADWMLFASFSTVAPRLGSARAVAGITLSQAVCTSRAIRLSGEIKAVRWLLAPQLGWLLYASAVPLIAARRVAR